MTGKVWFDVLAIASGSLSSIRQNCPCCYTMPNEDASESLFETAQDNSNKCGFEHSFAAAFVCASSGKLDSEM